MKMSFSNIMLLMCFPITIIALNLPELYVFWMNNVFLEKWLYHVYFFQFFSSTLIHGSVLHLLTNSVFFFIFWNLVENIIWKKKIIYFYLFSSVFIGLWLSYFSNWNTVWMSWFLMALLSYYTIYLYSKKDPEYKWWITAIIVSIIIWLDPGISFYGHFFWAIVGVIFFLLNHNYLKKQYIGVEY